MSRIITCVKGFTKQVRKKTIRTHFTWERYLSALVVSFPTTSASRPFIKYTSRRISMRHPSKIINKKKHGWKKYYGRRQTYLYIELLRSARNPKHLTRSCLYNTSTSYVRICYAQRTDPSSSSQRN